MRKRFSKAGFAQLDQQIIDMLNQDTPQSVRHIFYRMTDPRLQQIIRAQVKMIFDGNTLAAQAPKCSQKRSVSRRRGEKLVCL